MKGIAMHSMYEDMAEIASKMNANPRAVHLMEVFPRVVQFSVSEEDDQFFVRIENSRIELYESTANDPDLVVRILNAAQFREVLHGKLDISHAFAQGNLTVQRGKLSEMILFSRIVSVAQRGKVK